MSTETYLQPDASRIACDVFVREKVLGPEDVVAAFGAAFLVWLFNIGGK